jgi:hypothetical protein
MKEDAFREVQCSLILRVVGVCCKIKTAVALHAQFIIIMKIISVLVMVYLVVLQV